MSLISNYKATPAIAHSGSLSPNSSTISIQGWKVSTKSTLSLQSTLPTNTKGARSTWSMPSWTSPTCRQKMLRSLNFHRNISPNGKLSSAILKRSKRVTYSAAEQLQYYPLLTPSSLPLSTRIRSPMRSLRKTAAQKATMVSNKTTPSSMRLGDLTTRIRGWQRALIKRQVSLKRMLTSPLKVE